MTADRIGRLSPDGKPLLILCGKSPPNMRIRSGNMKEAWKTTGRTGMKRNAGMRSSAAGIWRCGMRKNRD